VSSLDACASHVRSTATRAVTAGAAGQMSQYYTEHSGGGSDDPGTGSDTDADCDGEGWGGEGWGGRGREGGRGKGRGGGGGGRGDTKRAKAGPRDARAASGGDSASRASGARGGSGGTRDGVSSRDALSFKGADGGDERWVLLIRACIQTAILDNGKTVTMWTDGRGAGSKKATKKTVAEKIARDLNTCEDTFRNALTADKVLDQFHAARRMLLSLRCNQQMSLSKCKEEVLHDLDCADRQVTARQDPGQRKKKARTDVRMMGARPFRAKPSRSRPDDSEDEDREDRRKRPDSEEEWPAEDGRRRKQQSRKRQDEDNEEEARWAAEDGTHRKKRKSSGVMERMKEEMDTSKNVVNELLSNPQHASTFAYSNLDIEQATEQVDKVMEAASKRYGKDSEDDLESLNACLHKYMTQMPSLIGRVKSWTARSDQDPASLLMTVAMRCQRILGKNAPPQEQQWPKIHAAVNGAGDG